MSIPLSNDSSLCVSWAQPPERPRIAADELHVWKFTFGAEPPPERLLAGYLDEREKRRADKTGHPNIRLRFMAGRALLKSLLARYLDVDAGRIVIDYGVHGKPALAGDMPGSHLRFNISHSNGAMLLAFAADIEVGVDVQGFNSISRHEEIAKRFFSPAEYDFMISVAPPRRENVFHDFWTCKEAFLKMKGLGIPASMRNFSIIFFDSGRNPAVRLNEEPYGVSGAGLQMLPAPSGASACVAAERQGLSLSLWSGDIGYALNV